MSEIKYWTGEVAELTDRLGSCGRQAANLILHNIKRLTPDVPTPSEPVQASITYIPDRTEVEKAEV